MRLTGSHRTFAPAQLEDWYATRADFDDRLDLAIIDRSSGEFTGEVVLNDLVPENKSCSFRILLIGAHNRGRGLGTEATRLILAHAFETVRLHRVELAVYAFNPRARRVYEKVGFVYEGTMRDALLWDGQWIGADTMSILDHEWASHRGHPVYALQMNKTRSERQPAGEQHLVAALGQPGDGLEISVGLGRVLVWDIAEVLAACQAIGGGNASDASGSARMVAVRSRAALPTGIGGLDDGARCPNQLGGHIRGGARQVREFLPGSTRAEAGRPRPDRRAAR